MDGVFSGVVDVLSCFNINFYTVRITLFWTLFWLGLALTVSSYWNGIVSPPIALALGLALSGGFGLANFAPNTTTVGKAVKLLLQSSVVGLGFGMNMQSLVRVGEMGVVIALVSVFAALALGWGLAKLLGVSGRTSYLMTVGAAICGGSAIAAVAPIIRAEESEISVSLGVVFVLNALALFIFPPVGAAFGLSQEQFGVWAAIAIHDTSSVVGAAGEYGDRALFVATALKLTRALAIIPLAVATAFVARAQSRSRKETTDETPPLAKDPFPLFIGLFLLAALLSTVSPAVASFAPILVGVAKTGLTATLFLLGVTLKPSALKKLGVKSLVFGLAHWACIAALTLWITLSFAR